MTSEASTYGTASIVRLTFIIRTSVGPLTKAFLVSSEVRLVKVIEATNGPDSAVSLSPVALAITETSATGRLECTTPV